MIKIKNGLITDFNESGIEFRQDLIPVSNNKARSGLAMIPTYITIHNPASGGASARRLTDYIDNYNGYKSWHLTVVGSTVFQELPFNEVSWHAGDGRNGTGNRKSISLEISEDTKSEETSVIFVAHLMKEYNIPIENVVPHKHWSGKNCPAYTLKHWDRYIEKVEKYYNSIITPIPHWAEKHKLSLEKKGVIIHEERYDDYMTRGEVFALLDRVVK